MEIISEKTLAVSIGATKAALPNVRFKTGSTGYFLGDKLTHEGKRYQVTISVVEIGSKPEK